MPDPSELDPRAVRLQFARRVRRIADGDFLLREIERRMLERLDLVRLEPERILDVGTGLGQGAARLQQRYPRACVLGVDIAEPMAAQAARLHGASALRALGARLQRWVGRALPGGASPLFAAGDARCLPLASSSVDLLWSNLAWHWFNDPRGVLDEWQRVARAGGLLMFSAFGVDTLRELRGLGVRLPPMHDLHDIGDALVGAGFAEPVMDAERLTVSWDSAAKLIGELRGLGGDALRGRPPGLRGRGAMARWLAGIESLAGPDGRISITFEIVYGHAWCPARKRLPAGYAPVDFVAKGGKASGRYPSE